MQNLSSTPQLTSGEAVFQTHVCPVSRMTLKTGTHQSDKVMRDIQNSINYHFKICKSNMVLRGRKFMKTFQDSIKFKDLKLARKDI